MAYRAGARVINMEFVQFHPTTFVGANGARFLITEAVRGDGGRLVHADNTPFMDKYDAVWKDLAPRDVVARAIYQEMLEHDVPYVYLNLRDYISEDRIRHHFPTILQRCADAGVDITNELVPVVPGAHYACGGVWMSGVNQRLPVSMPSVRLRVPDCMALTASHPQACSRALCGATVLRST
jgi:L-aspartate oxidase